MNVFLDKSARPDDRDLSRALGTSFCLWEDIKAGIRAEYGPAVEEWKYYGATAGWTLKFLIGGRNMFFMAARPGFFRIAFIFGDKAVAAIEKGDFPGKLIEEIRSARKYAEGRGLTIEVRTAEDATNVLKLITVKMHPSGRASGTLGKEVL